VAKHRSSWMTEDLDQLRRLARDVFAKELTPHQERFAGSTPSTGTCGGGSASSG
jgi:hypothetical protein